MELVICLLVGVLLFIFLLPREVFINKSIYKSIKRKEEEQKEVEFENRVIFKFIHLSRRMSKYIPATILEKESVKLSNNIQYAGVQNKISVKDFLGAKVLITTITFAFFMFITLISPSMLNFLITIIASIMAYFVPDNWISMKAKRRKWTMEKEIPTILSSLAIITDAGLNLIPAIEETVRQHSGELSKEFEKTLEEIHIGVPQQEAFLRLSKRCNIDEITYFVSALTQGLEKGNSGITKIIREQAKESWNKRKYRAKELAEKASMKLFMPLLLLVFPAFIIFLIAPMIFSLFQTF
jgi:tight adherence protein C